MKAKRSIKTGLSGRQVDAPSAIAGTDIPSEVDGIMVSLPG